MNREAVEYVGTKEIVESIVILAKPRMKRASLSVVSDGKHVFYSLDRENVLWLIESAVESLRKMDYGD